MEILIGGRRTGRTACIKWAAENDAYIVCATQQQARELVNRAKDMGLTIKFPITFDELPMHNAYPTKIAIDNADWLLRRFIATQHELGFITLEQ